MKDEEKTKKQLIQELRELRLQGAQKLHEIKQNKILFQAILDESKQVFYVKEEQDLSLIWVSKEYEEIVGVTNGAVLGKTNRELFGKERGLIFDTEDREVLAGKRIAIEEPNGSRTFLTNKFQITLPDGARYLCGVSTDITEIKEIQEQLMEKQSYLQAILDYSPTLISIKNLQGDVILVNKNFGILEGPHPEEFIGRNVYDLFPHEIADELWKNDRAAIESGAAVEVEESVKHRDGETHTYLSIKFPIYKSNEEMPFGICAISTDITKRKRLEAQLLQAQKMEAIGVLTGGIAHQFNNLLYPILGHTELMIRDKSKGDPDLKRLEQIEIAGKRVKSLVQQMLAYGRQSFAQKEAVSVEAIVENTLGLIRNTMPSNIQIKTEIERELPRVQGVFNELNQVLLNLCINASQSMQDGGELVVGLKMKKSHKFVGEEQERTGAFVCLSVKDSGVGMDQPTIDRIFDPFFTTKEVGQGS